MWKLFKDPLHLPLFHVIYIKFTYTSLHICCAHFSPHFFTEFFMPICCVVTIKIIIFCNAMPCTGRNSPTRRNVLPPPSESEAVRSSEAHIITSQTKVIFTLLNVTIITIRCIQPLKIKCL